mgnify:CR=1 FL=1
MDLYEVVTKEDKLLRKKSQVVPEITPNVINACLRFFLLIHFLYFYCKTKGETNVPPFA